MQLVPKDVGRRENYRTSIIFRQPNTVQSLESYVQSLLRNTATGQVAFPEFFTILVRIGSMEALSGVGWAVSSGGRGG